MAVDRGRVARDMAGTRGFLSVVRNTGPMKGLVAQIASLRQAIR